MEHLNYRYVCADYEIYTDKNKIIAVTGAGNDAMDIVECCNAYPTLKQSNEHMQQMIKETTDLLKEIYIRLGTIKFKSPEGDADFDKLSESIEIVEQLLNKEG